jgi:hypothetical protein
MPIVLPRMAAVSGALALVLLGLTGPGCKRREPAPETAPSAAPSAPATPAEMTRCRKREDFTLVLEADRPAAKPAAEAVEGEAEEDDTLMPFGVDLGEAVATPFGFAVAGIHGVGRAFVAVLGASASRRVQLGELHGDAETPAIAASGDDVLVALRTTDAAGFTIKLGRVAGPERASIEWGYELTKLGRAVTNVELATLGEHGVLVFESELKGEPRLVLGSFAPRKLAAPLSVKPLDVKGAEMPRLLTRDGGFWLSWVRSLPAPKQPGTPSARDAEPPRDPEERELLDPGFRVVEVLKLDERGQPLGTPLRVGEPRRQVVLYDVAPLSSGGLLVATRSDGTAPGAEGGAILLSEVSPDGSVREERWEDDDLGAGAPTLLIDVDGAKPGPWLTVSGPNDATRVGLARGARTTLQSDPLLGRSEVVAVSGGHFLAQRARGSSVVLEALDCSWPSDAAPEQK